MDLPLWEGPFPPRKTLRAEVESMITAVRDVLLSELDDTVAGLYLVGSAQRPWDTPLDYVPELSDIDIHVRFAEATDAKSIDTTAINTAQCLDIQQEIEAHFFSQHPHSLHVPRPQIIVLNGVGRRQNPRIQPSDAVRVLYGEPYPDSTADITQYMRDECERMIAERAYLDRLPYKIIDRPGHYLWEVLQSVAWYISAVGPRVLMFSGVAPEKAWSLNRTQIVQELCARGETELAEAYASYYIAAWQYYFSGRTYSVAAREAVRAGIEVLERGIEAAHTWKNSVY